MKHNEIDQAVCLLEDVGCDIMRWRSDSSARTMLSEAQFKTEADQRAHDALNKGLEGIFPGLPILSEEDKKRVAERPETYWLIDPIDGTASWYGGFSGFVTQAALMSGGTPIAGIVHAPALQKTWSSVVGGGVFCNNNRLAKLMPHSRIVVTDNYPTPQRAAALMMSHLPSAAYLESGSLGLKCCLVVEGTADLFVKDVVVRDWDIAPAALMLNEVGGFLSLPDGSEYIFNGDMEKNDGVVVARDEKTARLAISTIKDAVM